MCLVFFLPVRVILWLIFFFFFINEHFICICFFKAQSCSRRTSVKLLYFAGNYTSAMQNFGDVSIQCFISAINKAVNYIDIQSEFGH